MYKYILFDLDGTLTDSAPGIIRCVQYALEKCGKGTCPDRELLPFNDLATPLISPGFRLRHDCRRSKYGP